MTQTTQPPGWYPDPTGRPVLLWWNGLEWTGEEVPMGPPPLQQPAVPQPPQRKPLMDRQMWVLLACAVGGILVLAVLGTILGPTAPETTPTTRFATTTTSAPKSAASAPAETASSTTLPDGAVIGASDGQGLALRTSTSPSDACL